MRFNPRQSAEELQDDSSVGREDSEERARHDAKKREDQDKRAKMMQGLQHMKIKIPQKNPEDEEDSPIKEQAELGQMTGQVGQSEANAGANPRASGMGGTNIMLSNDFIDEVFDLIRKKRDKPAFDTEKRPKRTKTVEDVKQRKRGLKGGKRRKRGDIRVEDKKRKRAKRGSGVPLRGGVGRRPALASTFTSSRAPYTSFGTGYTYGLRTAPQRLPGFTGRSRAKRSYPDPRQREHEADLQQYRQNLPLQDVSPQTPTKTVTQRLSTPIRGRGRKKPHSKALRQPKQTDTPGGQIMSEATSLAGGAGGIGASDAILASEEFLHKRAQKVKLSLSPRDRLEYRRLVDQLNHLMRRMMRKEDKSMQGADEKSSPNSSGGLTSAPTGATETDPEDDATTWGAHAYDLYTRRGGIA